VENKRALPGLSMVRETQPPASESQGSCMARENLSDSLLERLR